MSVHKRNDLVGRDAKKWQVKWRETDGRPRSASFATQGEAKAHDRAVHTALAAGTYVPADKEKITVAEWAQTWADGYGGRVRKGTSKMGVVHVNVIKAGNLAGMKLKDVRASHINLWTRSLSQPAPGRPNGYAQSYIRAVYRRFSQIMTAAVDDGLIHKNPCNRSTTQREGKKRVYVASTEQVFALHEAMRDELKVAILLGAFAGLRIAEAAGLDPADVDVMGGVIQPNEQWPTDPHDPSSTDLKTDNSYKPIEIAAHLSSAIFAAIASGDGTTIMRNQWGQKASPKVLQDAFALAKTKVPGLPAGFRFHDLRHYFASTLIDGNLNILMVAERMRQNPAETLRTYGHLFPKADGSRAAVERVWDEREAAKQGAEPS